LPGVGELNYSKGRSNHRTGSVAPKKSRGLSGPLTRMFHATGCGGLIGSTPRQTVRANDGYPQSAVGRRLPVGSDVVRRLTDLCGAGFPPFRLCEPADP
jgi:hypothetical protein